MSLARRLAACVVLASLGLTGGCSFIFVTGPEKVTPGRYEAGACTTSQVAPVLDMVVLSSGILRTIVVFDHSDADYRGSAISRDADIAAGMSLSLLFVVSAIYGYATVDSCREVRGGQANPYRREEVKGTSAHRKAEEAAEEAAVQARQRAKAAEAKAPPAAAPAGPTVEIPDAGPPAAP